MSNELATPDAIANLVANSESQFANEQALATVTKVGDYLPFVQLYGSNSKEVKRGAFPMGHFGLRRSKSAIDDLGDQVVMFVLGWRPKAMQFEPEPISYFNPESDAFKNIQATADGKNSGKGYGPEFFIWLPEVKEFATYFLGNKTGRNESPNLLGPFKASGPFTCIQESTLIETKQYSWHGPKTKPYSLSIEMPPLETLTKELQKFNSPPEAAKEPTEHAEEADDSRR